MDQDNNLTKTRAKKSLLLTFDEENKSKILKDLKSNFPQSTTTSSTSSDDKLNLRVEFRNFTEAKMAKTLLSKLHKNETLKIESQLHQVKKENWKIEKTYRQTNTSSPQETKFTEQHGQLGDRSRNLFEIRIPKIILRNLSFKFNEESLRKEMEPFGQVELVSLPKREGAQNHNGFGFVIFKTLKDAQKAIETLNAKKDKLLGTKVAADWCLPKNLYIKNTTQNNLSENINDSEKPGDDDDDDKEEEEDEENSEADDSKEAEKVENQIKKRKKKPRRKTQNQN